MLTISASTDWPAIKTEIQNLSRTLPVFKSDFVRISTYLDQQVTILSKLEVDHRRTKSKYILTKCSDQVLVINQSLSQIQQMYLMSILGN